MAAAFKCDLCGKLTEYAKRVRGLDFKIGEYRDGFTGRHDKMRDIRDVCPECHKKIMETVESIYARPKE